MQMKTKIIWIENILITLGSSVCDFDYEGYFKILDVIIQFEIFLFNIFFSWINLKTKTVAFIWTFEFHLFIP